MARIKLINVSSAGNISHPNPQNEKILSFSQLKSSVDITAELEASDNLDRITGFLQEQADKFVRADLDRKYKQCLEKK